MITLPGIKMRHVLAVYDWIFLVSLMGNQAHFHYSIYTENLIVLFEVYFSRNNILKEVFHFQVWQ